MIVDTSALVAIVRGEPDAPALLTAMRDADGLSMSAATALELSLVIGPARHERGLAFLEESGIAIVAFTAAHLAAARAGHARYGRGSGSRARLNFGDCFSYALAKVTGEPLLFKGDDFTHTDVTPALKLPP
jgi:ribonuclease VapC